MSVFAIREGSVCTSTRSRTAESDDAVAARFNNLMHHAYSLFWNGQRGRAFDNFYKAFALIEILLKMDHVGFVIYIFDLMIRHDGAGDEEPLLMLLQHLSEMSKAVFRSEEHPVFLVANYLRNMYGVSRPWLTESTLRRLLDFFQDRIGYFHPETIALLQILATGLIKRKRFAEAAIRFRQLVDVFETTMSKPCYQICHALYSTFEAYLRMEQYEKSLQALKTALESAEALPRLEKIEISVQCLRGLSEVRVKLGRKDEENATMQHVMQIRRNIVHP